MSTSDPKKSSSTAKGSTAKSSQAKGSPGSTRTRRTFPVSVTRLPVVRCAVCGQTIAHRPGQAAAVLTSHYEAVHAGTVR